MESKDYEGIAVALNKDFRTVLHAVATPVGISIASICPLDLRRLAANIEVSRALAGKHLDVSLDAECGIICIR